METIIYQGQAIEAEQIAETGGYMGKLLGQSRHGGDELFRDQAGRYYLRYERFDGERYEFQHEAEEAGAVFARVHRVNLNAAILWAVSNLGSEAMDLRCDAADLLTEGRGYRDPAPTTSMRQVTAPARREITSPLKGDYQGALATLDADAETITVPLTLPVGLYRAVLAMGEYDGQEGFSQTVAASMRGDVQSWLEAEDERIPADFLLQWLKDHPQPVSPTQPATAATDKDGTTRLEFTYAPTPERVGGSMEILVDAEQMAQAEKLANHFCLGARQFLALLALNDLPDQPNDDEAALRAEHVAFACKDKKRVRRLRRAAKAGGCSLEGLVAEAVSSFVKMYEDDMIVHPRTGRLLHADHHELFTRGKHEITAAPLGREHEPQWLRHLHRQHVNFSAHLTPEQMERLEYPHFISDCATDRELPCVLIPYDAEEGLPFLRINGRDVAPSQPLPTAELGETLPVHVALASLAACLDTHVFGLLCTYLGENPEDDPRDVVNGYLASMLECEVLDRSRSAAFPLAEARTRRLAQEAGQGSRASTVSIPVYSTEELSRLGRAGLAVPAATNAAKGVA